MTRDYESFRQNINNAITECNLDVGAVYFILKDVFTNVEHLYYAQLNKEALDESKARREKEEEQNNGVNS